MTCNFLNVMITVQVPSILSSVYMPPTLSAIASQTILLTYIYVGEQNTFKSVLPPKSHFLGK